MMSLIDVFALFFVVIANGNYLPSRQFIASEYIENGVFFPIQSNENAFINLVNNLDLNYLSQIPVANRELLDIHLNFSNINRAKSILNIAKSPEFASTVSQALNTTLDNIVLISSDFFCKQPIEYKVIGWHQDQAWFEMEPLNKFLNIWVAIDYADRNNGCVKFKRKSHESGKLFKHLQGKIVNDSFTWSLDIPLDYNGSDSVSAQLVPSQAVVFSGITMHASNNNISGRRRCGISLRYMIKNWKYQENARTKIIGDGTVWQPQSLTLDSLINDYDSVLQSIQHHYDTVLAPQAEQHTEL